jgi:hypothetical protein
MLSAPGHVFVSIEGDWSRFHIFLLPDMFLGVPRAWGPVFMFCSPGLVFGGTEGVGSRFHVLRARTHFRRHRGRRDPFSCFTRPDTFSAIQRASGPVFSFCAPGLVSDGTEGVRSSFHVLRARTSFRRYGWRLVPFCALGLVFGDSEGVGYRFHV